jgi:hypothetical protein
VFNSSQQPLRPYAVVFWLLTSLFFLRVVGQFLVTYWAVPFLPPMSEWYSGLIPYPVLLPIQILLLIVMTMIGYHFTTGTGVFLIQKRRVGLGLKYFSYLYFGSMVLRYIITMAFHPEQRWFGGTIPIFFHWILAGYIFTLGSYHTCEHARRA